MCVFAMPVPNSISGYKADNEILLSGVEEVEEVTRLVVDKFVESNSVIDAVAVYAAWSVDNGDLNRSKIVIAELIGADSTLQVVRLLVAYSHYRNGLDFP